MNHKALKELKDIIKLPDWNNVCPEKLRQEQLQLWIDRWLVEVEYAQDVVDTKYLTSEYSDLIKTKLSQNIAEELTETCTNYKVTNRRVAATLVALRRRGKS